MFHFAHLLINWPLLLAVDALSKFGRTPHPSELRRLYTENLALKAVNEVLRTELHRTQGKREPLSLKTRAAQVFVYLLTRGNKLFQDSFLGSSPATVRKWAKQRLSTQEEALKRAIREQGPVGTIEPLSEFISFAQLAEKQFSEGDQAQKRSIVLKTVSNLFVKDKIAHIQAKKAYQLLLVRPRSSDMSACVFVIHMCASKDGKSLTKRPADAFAVHQAPVRSCFVGMIAVFLCARTSMSLFFLMLFVFISIF